jgi:hypothetical protein
MEAEEDQRRAEDEYAQAHAEMIGAAGAVHGPSKSAIKFLSKTGLNWADMSDESKAAIEKIVKEHAELETSKQALDQSPSATPILDGCGFSPARHTDETKPIDSFIWDNMECRHEEAMGRWIMGDSSALHVLVNCNPEQLIKSSWFSEYKTAYYDVFGYDFRLPVKASKAYVRKDGRVMAKRVGTANVRCQPDKQGKRLPDDIKEILKRLGAPNAAKYEMPPTGPEAVRASLKSQLQSKTVGSLREVLDDTSRMEILRDHCQDWAEFHFNPDLAEAVDAYLNTVEQQSSSGWTANAFPGNKGIWKQRSPNGLTNKCDLLLYLVQCRIALLFACSKHIHWLSPIDMIKLGLSDPVLPFVKTEGHKEEKIADQRYRLIWNVSIVDNVIHFWAYNNSNKADLARYIAGEIPPHSMGMGHHDEGIRHLGKSFDEMFKVDGTLAASDAKAFDLSVTREMLYLDGERRFIKAHAPDKLLYGILTQVISATISASVLCIDKGLLQLEDFGVTKSGLQTTTTQNTFIRGCGLRVSGAVKVVCQSDDAVHVGPVDYDFLSRLGVQTKGEPKVLNDESEIDFTSHLYKRSPSGKWTAKFLNLDKMLAHAYFRTPPGFDPKPEMLSGMMFALRNTPEALAIFTSFAREMGWDLADIVPQDVEWE